MHSTVELTDLDSGATEIFTLVFPEDADFAADRLSEPAPIGVAVLGYQVGDEFEWKVPAGVRRLCYSRPMKLVDTDITMVELRSMAENRFGDLVKAVVDIRRKIMVVDADLHSDEEALLIEHGSMQADLWGINLYPELPPGEWIEFDSMINIRPSRGNLSRGVDDADVRNRIVNVVTSLVRE